MKKTIQTIGIIGMMILTSFRINAQCDVLSHTWSSGYYVGWASAHSLDFKLGSTPTQYMTLNTSGYLGIGNGYSPSYKLDVDGDMNISSSNAFRTGGTKILWGATTVLSVGMDAGNTSAAAQNTFVGNKAGQNTASDGGYNTFLGYKAGYGNVGSLGTGGTSNTYIDDETAVATSYGNDNTFVGYYAGNSNQTSGNTFVGRGAGTANQDGTGNTFLGTESGVFYNSWQQ